MNPIIFISALLVYFSFPANSNYQTNDCTQDTAFKLFDQKIKQVKVYNDDKTAEFAQKIEYYKNLLYNGPIEDQLEKQNIESKLIGISSDFYASTVERKNKLVMEIFDVIESMDSTSSNPENCAKFQKVEQNLNQVHQILREEWGKVMATIESKIAEKSKQVSNEKAVVKDFSSRRPEFLVGLWIDVVDKEQNLLLSKDGNAKDQDYTSKSFHNSRYWFIRDSELCMSMVNDTTSQLCMPFKLSNDTLNYKFFGEWSYYVKKKGK